jgi:hypothetical protein
VGKLDKFKQIFAAAEPLAKPFVPGGVGNVLDVVNGALNKGAPSPASADAIKQLAVDNDQQTQAILALHARLKAAEDTIVILKQKLGL